MIRSMTGYGRAEAGGCAAEIRSVNNRYLDLTVHLPRSLSFLETRIRSLVKESVGRGKVDLFITTDGSTSGQELVCNEELAGSYVSAMRRMAGAFGLPDNIRVTDLLKASDVFTFRPAGTDEETVWSGLAPVLEEAVSAFNEAREGEGERLASDLGSRLDELASLTAAVRAHEPEILDAYRTRLKTTLSELLDGRGVEESQIASAAVIYADKICTDEETVRLESHIAQMRDVLTRGGSVGRRLDFLAQEMNREANTTLSKAGDLVTADLGIAMKTDIEKIREQIQNLE